MKNLIRRIAESKTGKLVAALGGLTYLTGCAKTDPNVAMATTVGGILLGSIPGASAADIAVGQALATGGALSYQRGSYENAARHVGGGNSGGRVGENRVQQNSNPYILSITNEDGSVAWRNPNYNQMIREMNTPEILSAGNWTDLNRNGRAESSELFEVDKRTFNPDVEDIYFILQTKDSRGNMGISVFWTLFSSRGDKICEYVGGPDPRGLSNSIIALSRNNPGLVNKESFPDGNYRMVARLGNGDSFYIDFEVKRGTDEK